MISKNDSVIEKLISMDFSWLPGGITTKIFIVRLISRIRGNRILTETNYGEKIYVNLNDIAVSWDVIRSKFDKGTTRVIEAVVNEGDQVLDIGANIGYYSVLISREVGGKGRLICFEPEKANYNILKSNLKRGRLDNYILEDSAVSIQCGSATLSLDKYNKGAHRVDPDIKSGINVETVTIDQYFEDKTIEDLDLIKIDVEGSEGKVLSGGKETITTYKPKIILEFNDSYWNDTDTKALEMLRKQGYDFYKIKEPSGEKEKLDIEAIVDSSGHFNLFCLSEAMKE